MEGPVGAAPICIILAVYSTAYGDVSIALLRHYNDHSRPSPCNLDHLASADARYAPASEIDAWDTRRVDAAGPRWPPEFQLSSWRSLPGPAAISTETVDELGDCRETGGSEGVE